MLLTVAAFLTTLGFATWGVGILLDYHGIAAIGGVLVVGTGAMVMVDGLEYRDGQIERTNSTANETIITPTYSPVDTLPSFPLGAVMTMLGGVQVIRVLDDIG